MARTTTRKMVNLDIEETSGVDHPAHLNEGWLVMKSADSNSVLEVLESSVIKQEESVSETIENRLEEAMDLLQKAEERIAELEESATEVEAEVEAPAEDDAEDVIKSAPEPVQKAFEVLRKQAEEAVAKATEVEAVLKSERDARADAEAVAKARSWSHLSLDAEQVGPALRKLAETDEVLAKSVEAVLESVNSQAESANIFAEIGRTSANTGNAFSQMESMAKSLVSAGEANTYEQAFANVAIAEPSLYAQYLNEKGA
jgi:hypothetical protein